MWDDYYSWQPTSRLERPLVLAGFYGSSAAQIGRFVSALSGLNCIDMERLLEHKLNTRLKRWVEHNELQQLEEREHQILQKALRQQPPAVILLPTHAVFNPSIQKQLLQGDIDGIVITRSRAALWNSFQSLWESSSDRFLELEKGTSLDEIHTHYLDWLSACPKSWKRQPMQTETALDIAQKILEHINAP